jgi:hypothetical protein
LDDVVDGEEIVREVQLLDEVELALDGAPLLLAQALLEPRLGAAPGQPAQVVDRMKATAPEKMTPKLADWILEMLKSLKPALSHLTNSNK